MTAYDQIDFSTVRAGSMVVFKTYKGIVIHRADVKRFIAYNKGGEAVCFGSSYAEVVSKLIRRDK